MHGGQKGPCTAMLTPAWQRIQDFRQVIGLFQKLRSILQNASCK